jgi:hypothetical protein
VGQTCHGLLNAPAVAHSAVLAATWSAYRRGGRASGADWLCCLACCVQQIRRLLLTASSVAAVPVEQQASGTSTLVLLPCATKPPPAAVASTSTASIQQHRCHSVHPCKLASCQAVQQQAQVRDQHTNTHARQHRTAYVAVTHMQASHARNITPPPPRSPHATQPRPVSAGRRYRTFTPCYCHHTCYFPAESSTRG